MSFYRQMLNTANSAGISILSEERKCQLLALAYTLGDESFVFAERLHTDTLFAAETLRCYGGGQMEPKIIRRIAKYASDLRDGRPEWLRTLEDLYGVQFEPHDKRSDEELKKRWEEHHGSVRIPKGEHGKTG